MAEESEVEPYVVEADKESVDKYAKAVDDLNPFYIDEEYAKKSKYGGLIAPPTYAVVYSLFAAMGVLTNPDAMKKMAGGEAEFASANIIHGEQEFEFFKPVKIGDKITTDAEFLNSYKKKNLNFFEFGTTSKDQDGEVVTKGKFLFIVPG